MRKISRRNFLLTAGVVSAAALLAACGNSASAVSSESASESTASSVESAASNETIPSRSSTLMVKRSLKKSPKVLLQSHGAIRMCP